jgi:hypothetical protein
MLLGIKLTVVMLGVAFLYYWYCYADCRYAECRDANSPLTKLAQFLKPVFCLLNSRTGKLIVNLV